MTTSTEEIISLFRSREQDMATVQAKRRAVRDAYNGELRVVLPDVGRAEPAAVANLLQTGLNQLAQRVSSNLPTIHCPPRDEQVKREQMTAEKRRRALYGWWEANSFDLMMPLRARQMLGYAQSPVCLWPDYKRGIPVWRMRDPLGTYPGATMNPMDVAPDDCIFAYSKTYDYVKRTYPDQFELLRRKEKFSRDDRLMLLDYVDDTEFVTIAVGEGGPQLPHDQWGTYTPTTGPGTGLLGSKPYVELLRLPNKAGICPAVVPGRITLDKMIGQFDGMLYLYQRMAHLTALELIAVEKGIFPDTFLESRPQEQAKFLTGPHDGRTGKVNIIQGGTIRELGTNPGFQTNPAIDRIERAMRLDGGVPPELGGESSSNIRTGRRGDQVLSAAVDFPIQEQQKIMAASLREENRRAAAVTKAYFGSRPQSFYVDWKGARGQVDYKAGEIFTTTDNIVRYSHLGTDTNGMIIQTGQAVGMGVLSKLSAARAMPFIEDPEFEHDQSIKESLEAALLAGIQQKINAGEIGPADAAWLMRQVQTNSLELAEAMEKLDERVRERQAAQPDPQMDPAAMMGGLATGTPAEAQAIPSAIPEGPESQQNLTSMLGALRLGQRQTPAERPQVA